MKNLDFSYPVQSLEFKAKVKVRYNMQAVDARVKKVENNWLISFEKPVSAIAKGQACVIYDIYDGHLIGGGFI